MMSRSLEKHKDLLNSSKDNENEILLPEQEEDAEVRRNRVMKQEAEQAQLENTSADEKGGPNALEEILKLHQQTYSAKTEKSRAEEQCSDDDHHHHNYDLDHTHHQHGGDHNFAFCGIESHRKKKSGVNKISN